VLASIRRASDRSTEPIDIISIGRRRHHDQSRNTAEYGERKSSIISSSVMTS
jgi:hypothetical protein